MAGNTIAKGSVVLTTNADGVAPGLAKTEGMLKSWGSKIGGVVSGGMGGGLMGGLTMAGPWGAALAAGATAVSHLVDKFGELSEGIDNASKSSRALGIDMESFQGLQHAADLSGVSMEQLEVGLGKFRRQVDGPLDEALFSLADRLDGIRDPGERAQLLVDSFGKSGLKMGAMFEDGRAGLIGFIDEAKQMGNALTAEEGKAIEAANDSITRVKAAGRGLWNTIIVATAPAIEKIGKVVTQMVVFLRPAFEWYGRFQTQLWTIASALWDATAEAISEVIGWVKELGASLFDWAGTLPTIEEIVVGSFRFIGETAALTWDSIKVGAGAISYVASYIVEGLAKVVDAFKETIKSVFDLAGNLPDEMGGEWFRRQSTDIDNWTSKLDGAAESMRKWGQGTFDNFGASILQFDKWLDRVLAKKDKAKEKPQGEGLSFTPMKFAAAIEQGTKEAYSMEVRNKFGDKAVGKDPVVGQLEKNGRKQDEGNRKLDKIERRLAELGEF